MTLCFIEFTFLYLKETNLMHVRGAVIDMNDLDVVLDALLLNCHFNLSKISLISGSEILIEIKNR